MLPLANIFQPLIDFFEAILVFIHDSLGISWGFSIITLTIVIRASLVPLTLKQLKSMHALQRLQPQMKALQAKYKGDKQRLNEEMMKFYKEHKVNPFASCLPMVAQLPVFISLYYMLRTDLRNDICPSIQAAAKAMATAHHHAFQPVACGTHSDAGFLFVPDLTGKAAGAVLVVLIVLYVGTTVGSTLLMSATADKTQRNIMLFLPLIFVTFVIQFPAGVVVYWITTNMWTIVQGYIVRKRLGPLPVPVASEGGGLSGMVARLTGREPPEDVKANGRPTKRTAEDRLAAKAGGGGGGGGGGGAAAAKSGGGKGSTGARSGGGKGGPSAAKGGAAAKGATDAKGGATVKGAPRAKGGAAAKGRATVEGAPRAKGDGAKAAAAKGAVAKGAPRAKGGSAKAAAAKADAGQATGSNGDGANVGGTANGKAPPPPPRKKKKRSGRRR